MKALNFLKWSTLGIITGCIIIFISNFLPASVDTVKTYLGDFGWFLAFIYGVTQYFNAYKPLKDEIEDK